MLKIEQYKKRGVCDISEVRNGKFTSFQVGASNVEGVVAIDNFLERYWNEREKERSKQ